MSLRSSSKLQVFLLSTGLILLFYAATASPRITLNDAGDLILAGQTLGIAHAPGYPLFTLLAFAFSKILWFLDPAQQVNIMTALFGAVACGLLSLIALALTGNRLLAMFAAFTLALTSMTWYLSATTEVYTLNLLFTEAIWLLAIQIHKKFTVKAFYSFCFLLGLSLSNSYPLIMLASVGLVLLTPVRSLTVKRVAIGLLLALVGLLPYAYFFIQSTRISELRYVFIDISTTDKIIEFILRKPYGVADQKASFLFEKFRVLWELLRFFSREFMLTTPVVAYGVYAAFRQRWKLRWPLLLSLLATSLVLALMLGVTPDQGAFLQFAEYLLPALSFLCLFMVFGLHALIQRYPAVRRLHGAILCLILLGAQGLHAQASANQRDNFQVENWGLALLNSLPPHSNLVFCGDEALPLEFLQTVKGVRPDIVPYSSYWGGTRAYLYITGPDVVKSIASDLTIEELLAASTVPTYITSCPNYYMEKGFTVKLKGLNYQIVTDKVPEQAGLALTPESLRALLDSILLGPAQENLWMIILRNGAAKMLLAHGVQSGIIADLAPLLKLYHYDEDKRFIASLASELAFASQFDLALSLYRSVGYEKMRDVDSGDAAVLCRLLLLQSDLPNAQQVCLIPEEKSRICNVDAKYNLGRAFWSDKTKSLGYLRGAKVCNPDSAIVLRAIEEREALP